MDRYMDVAANAPYAFAGVLLGGLASYRDREPKYLKTIIILYAVAAAPFILFEIAGEGIGMMAALIYMATPIGLIVMPAGAYFCGAFAIVAIGSIVVKRYRE